MKTIKRIIPWVVDKSIYLLIGIKDFTPTLVPDDWSPDGSMHFLCFDHPIGSRGFLRTLYNTSSPQTSEKMTLWYSRLARK